MHTRRLAASTILVSVLLSGTAAAASPPAASPPAASPVDPWVRDLKKLDLGVRIFHPDPFAINPESAWVAKLAELQRTLPTATPDQQITQLASLVGLLDTHSWFTAPFHAYDVLVYPFSDGWFVVRARDKSLVGSRLVSIAATPVAQVEAAMRPLVPADNESGELDGLQYPMVSVEYLHGLGIVGDPAKPGYLFEHPDGTQTTVDLTSSEEPTWEQDLGIIGDLMGDAPEAVARRGEAAWGRIDAPSRTFLFSFNDYQEGTLDQPIAAMRAALDAGSVDRVVLDMRYLRGGNGSLAGPLIDALRDDPRINKPGGLTVMIGRENVSAGTIVAGAMDRDTQAVLVGEQTPARADNFLCDCHDIVLPNSGFTVTVPTVFLHNGDTRDSVAPDVPMSLSAADFFAGKDPVLDAVLGGVGVSPAP
jgi:hypothetical protein